LAVKARDDLVRRRREVLERRLQEVLELLPRLDVERAILFGSMARGEIGMRSDIDLLLIRKTEAPFVRRPLELEEIKGVDLIVYTPEEFEAMKERPFIKAILREGKVIYEKSP